MSESTTVESTPLSLQARLYVMMFLQYFVQGCYLPIISVYLEDALGFNDLQKGIFGSALSVGPLVAPFILGQVVDRYLPTQRVLAACHLAGAVLMLILYTQQQVVPIIILGTLYSILYVPTLMLTNSLTFHHLRRRSVEFPIVRFFGTLGFVVPAWVIELWLLRGLTGEELNHARGVALLLSGLAGIVMALYCLSLPSTPPIQDAKKRFAPGVVLGLLRRRDFRILVAIGFMIAIVHNFYFVQNGPFLRWFLDQLGIQEAWVQRMSSIGQISELVVMIGLGWLISWLGFKWTLALGALAYLLRCVIFSQVPMLVEHYPSYGMPIVFFGLAMHGLCFACFWAAAFIYVDRVAPPDIRGSMQTFYGTFVFGSGMFVGGLIAGGVGHLYTTGSGDTMVRNWSAIWWISGAIALVSLVAFVFMFSPRANEADNV